MAQQVLEEQPSFRNIIKARKLCPLETTRVDDERDRLVAGIIAAEADILDGMYQGVVGAKMPDMRWGGGGLLMASKIIFVSCRFGAK